MNRTAATMPPASRRAPASNMGSAVVRRGAGGAALGCLLGSCSSGRRTRSGEVVCAGAGASGGRTATRGADGKLGSIWRRPSMRWRSTSLPAGNSSSISSATWLDPNAASWVSRRSRSSLTDMAVAGRASGDRSKQWVISASSSGEMAGLSTRGATGFP